MTTFVAPPRPLPGPLWTLPGVYAPQADTRLLGRVLREEAALDGADLLDIGTGSGALALLAARMGARVTATDISWRAVVTARMNAARQRQGRRIRVRRGDLAGSCHGRRYDLVVANPPYVPAPQPLPPTMGVARAWDAGRDGRYVVDRLCTRAPALLRPGGALLMAHSGLCGVEASLRRLADAGMTAGVAARASVPFGPVLGGRIAWLRARGLIGPGEEREERYEELVVIRACL